MEIEAPRSGSAKLSMAPLIDIVFLLLVFFLLTSALASSDTFDLDLPKSEAGRDPDAEAIVLQISKDGQIALGPRIIPVEEIGAALIAEAGGEHEARQAALLVKADGAAYTQHVMEIVDAARAIGLRKLTIATSPQ